MAQFTITCQEGLSTTVRCIDTGTILTTDAPKEHGGKGVAFSPTDLVAAALGTCIMTIMGLYAKKLGVDFTQAKAKVIKNPGPQGGIGELIVHVYHPSTFEASIQSKLEQGANHCPVHQILDPKVKQSIVFHWGQSLEA